MSNFAFLSPEFRAVAKFAAKAEGHIMGDPRAACFTIEEEIAKVRKELEGMLG